MKPQLGDIDWLVGELIPPSLGSLLLYQFSLLALPQYASLPIKLPSETSLKGHTGITTVVKNDLAILRRKNFSVLSIKDTRSLHNTNQDRYWCQSMEEKKLNVANSARSVS